MQNQSTVSNHQKEDDLRWVIGLPSIATGVDYEGTRNPLLEVGIRSLYDMPNGHDYSMATSFFGNPMMEEAYRATIREYNCTWLFYDIEMNNMTWIWGGYNNNEA